MFGSRIGVGIENLMRRENKKKREGKGGVRSRNKRNLELALRDLPSYCKIRHRA